MSHLSNWLRRSLLLAAAGAAFSLEAEPVNFKISTTLDPGLEGPGVTRNYISVGKRRLAMRLPQHCEITSAPDNITVFVNQDGVSGQFTVSNSAFAPAQDFMAKVDDYRVAAEKTLPKEAESPEFKGGRFDLYAINDWKCLSFEWNYTFFAHPTQRQVAYIDLDSEHQVHVLIIADDTSWKTTFGTAQRFIKSWYWLESPTDAPVK